MLIKYSSAVGNDLLVNLPNTVPFIKWSVISWVYGIAYECINGSINFNSLTACSIAFLVGTILPGFSVLIFLKFGMQMLKNTIQLKV